MLKSRDSVICSLLAAGLSLAAVESRADVFDFLRPKRAAVVARAQAPGGSYGAPAYSPRSLWQPQPAANGQGASAANAQNGLGYDAAPSDNYASSYDTDGGPTVNCGECDRYQGRVSFYRKLCHQTYYPRSAPYCMPDWGWNQTCWRRMKDNYNCPRPDCRGSCPEPQSPLPPQEPVMPPATTYLPAPRTQANRAVSYGRSASPLPERQTYQGHAPLRGQADPGATPESESESGDWNYEEEAESAPVAAPPRESGRSPYYLSPASRR